MQSLNANSKLVCVKMVISKLKGPAIYVVARAVSAVTIRDISVEMSLVEQFDKFDLGVLGVARGLWKRMPVVKSSAIV